MIDWPSKRPTLIPLLGKKTGPQIAEIIDVSIHSLHRYCNQNGLSLKIDKEHRKPSTRKPQRKRAEERALEALPTISVDPHALWRIPNIPGVTA